MNWLRAQWHHNGTKILGLGGTLIGSLSLLDHETIDMIGNTLGPNWGPRAKCALMIIGGVAVAFRGYRNSQVHP